MKNILNIFLLAMLWHTNIIVAQVTPLVNQFQEPIDKGEDIYEEPPAPTALPPSSQTPPPPTDETRLLIWAHGHGGDEYSWQKAAAAVSDPTLHIPGFNSRDVQNFKVSYDSQNANLATAASHVHDELQNQYCLTPTPLLERDPMLIAHSMGGLIARRMEQIQNDPSKCKIFNGMATFGTPHDGAQVANNRKALTKMFEDFGTEFAIGPVQDSKVGRTVTFLNLLGADINIDQMTRRVVGGITGALLDFGFSEFNSPMVADAEVGSQVISNLRIATQQNTTMHRVAFYGVANPDGLIWRQIYAFALAKPNSFNTFEANDDASLIYDMQKNLADYVQNVKARQRDVEDTQKNINVFCSGGIIFPMWIPFCALNAKKHKDAKEARNAWQRGVDALNGIDDKWKVLIGATKLQTIQKSECVCRDYKTGRIVHRSNINNCPFPPYAPIHSECEPEVSVTYNTVTVPSDGFVLAESAKALPNTNSIIEMKLTNHQYMRNNKETKRCLQSLFNGEYEGYFLTKKTN